MMLFSEEDTVNSRAVSGYWNENPVATLKKGKKGKKGKGREIPVQSMKNTVIISRATLKDDGQYNIEGNDIALDQAYVNDAVAQVNVVFRQENIRKKIRTNGRMRTRAVTRNQEHGRRRASTRFFTKWLKRQDSDVHDVLKRADPYIRKKHMEILKEIYINEGRNKK